MNEEHFVEFNAVIGPIDPPYKLHTVADGRPQNTVHGELVGRLYEALREIAHDADSSAQITTEAEMQRRADVDAENRRLRAVVVAAQMLMTELDAHPITNLSEGITDAQDLLSEKLAAALAPPRFDASGEDA